MKREYIMSEEERHARKAKITEKKQLRDVQNEGFTQIDTLERRFDLLMPSSTNLYLNLENSIIQSITSEDNCPSPLTATRMSQSPDLPVGSYVNADTYSFMDPPLFSPTYLNGNFQMPTQDSSDDNSAKVKEEDMSAINNECENVTKLLNKVKVIRESNYYPTKYALLCRAKNIKRELTSQQKFKLKKLTSNVQLMQAETIHELPTSERFLDMVKITEIITYMLIKMCKKLPAFVNLCQEDQVGLVKGGCMETLLLRSIMTINIEKECWESLVSILSFIYISLTNSIKS